MLWASPRRQVFSATCTCNRACATKCTNSSALAANKPRFFLSRPRAQSLEPHTFADARHGALRVARISRSVAARSCTTTDDGTVDAAGSKDCSSALWHDECNTWRRRRRLAKRPQTVESGPRARPLERWAASRPRLSSAVPALKVRAADRGADQDCRGSCGWRVAATAATPSPSSRTRNSRAPAR